MKLQTTIRPRSSGIVTVKGDDGKNYVFAPDQDGALVAEIDHEETLTRLLGLGDFSPYDPEDFESASELLKSNTDPDDDGGDDDDGDGDGSGNPDALPIEANTPLKPPRDPKAGGKPRKVPKVPKAAAK